MKQSNNRMSIATVPSHRRISLAAGIAYLLTFVSIPTLALYNSVKRANYVLGSGPDTAAIVGGLLEIIVGARRHRYRRDPVPDPQETE